MSNIYIFCSCMNEIRMIESSNNYYNGSVYIKLEQATNFYQPTFHAAITVIKEEVHIAEAHVVKIAFYYDCDLDSNISDSIFITEDGLLALSVLDHHLNYDDIDTDDALKIMDTIAYGEYLDEQEQVIEDENFDTMIDEAYLNMGMEDITTLFNNINFVPSIAHISAFAYCDICEIYGHNLENH